MKRNERITSSWGFLTQGGAMPARLDAVCAGGVRTERSETICV